MTPKTIKSRNTKPEMGRKKHNPIEKGIISGSSHKRRKGKFVEFGKAKRFEPKFEDGLSSLQVEERIQDGLVNITAKKSSKTIGGIIFSNVFTFFNVLTFIVAAALIWAGATFAQLFFLLIIVANILIGIIQEIRSKITVEKLRLMTAPSAEVVRDGNQIIIPISEVVLDDVIHLETGKQICADCVLMIGQCEVNESMITGESDSVRKSTGDILYSGSYVSSGSCYARVDKIGKENYIEKLVSNARKYQKPRSELKNSITLIIKIVTIFIVPITILMIMGGLTRGDNGVITDEVIRGTIMRTSASVIGMIPAGMFLLTSVALAIGVLRLAKRKAVVQDLYCIEMLARVDVLCLDKTGTLTDGSLQVKKIIPLADSKHEPKAIISSMLSATGDNNQTAIALGQQFGYDAALVPKIILAFSSQRKFSAVTFVGEGTYALGAPEFVLRYKNKEVDRLVAANAAEGYRVILLGRTDEEMTDDGDIPKRFEPVCLMALEDHIREDAKETIQWFKDNDVAIKIISGDNPITVAEVAKRVGVEDAEKYISLDGLSSREVVESATKYTVFGRVSPEQKCLLIRALKTKGHTVAMTGDGVNDILAMREADCSVAIATGSEAARNVSHLILMGSNFSAMPDVVVEGRRVVNNITKSSSLFLMKTFMSIVLSLLFILMGKDYPLTTNNLLLLEVLIIGIPSFFLALQTNKHRIQGNFLSNVVSRAIPGGCALVVNVMLLYLYAQFMNANFGPDTLTSQMLETLMVCSLAFTGFMILLKICEPFNVYRVFLVIMTFVLIVLTIIVIGPDLGINGFDVTQSVHLTHIFFLIIEVLAAYFTVSFCMKLLIAINVMSET